MVLDHGQMSKFDVTGFQAAVAKAAEQMQKATTAIARAQFANQCTRIADRVVPEYRSCRPPYPSCSSPTAKRWQAAWDGACIALGRDPKEYLG